MQTHTSAMDLAKRIEQVSIKFDEISELPLDGLLRRIGDARVVMIGEASHGTSEFYQARARITQALIERKHFNFVAIEGDWPDAARIDHYVRQKQYPASEWTAFARFPTWMWRNEEVGRFVDWLRSWNQAHAETGKVAFHGLDIYSLYTSMHEVLTYLQKYDPATARQALSHYQCLFPYRDDPAEYARAAIRSGFVSCEPAILDNLKALYRRQSTLASYDGERLFDLLQNANLIASAEEYYRTMFLSEHNAWNLRDTHMFATLERLLEHYGSKSRGIIWAHNSHVGDSGATDMRHRGEFNIGRLARARFGDALFSIGFGTDTGTVAAASDWGADMEIRNVRPSLPGSYERVFHDSGVLMALAPLRHGDAKLIHGLRHERLQRAIGVIYRPETERQSHYYHACLPAQFDEYIWFDRSQSITPLDTTTLKGLPDTYPFGV